MYVHTGEVFKRKFSTKAWPLSHCYSFPTLVICLFTWTTYDDYFSVYERSGFLQNNLRFELLTQPCIWSVQNATSGSIFLNEHLWYTWRIAMITTFRNFRQFLVKKMAFSLKTNFRFQFLRKLAVYWLKMTNCSPIVLVKIFLKSSVPRMPQSLHRNGLPLY
jgi:hypothetical protein